MLHMNLEKYKLKRGDKIAVVSPSSGKASKYPNVYKEGIKSLKEIFGLTVVEYPTSRMSDNQLSDNPKLRAVDINNAFEDSSIKGIITTIGGDDSVRILPFLNKKVIQSNPKIFLGYSDATVLHVYLNQLGLITFYGPSIMAGFAQTNYLPKQFAQHINDFLFTNFEEYNYKAYPQYCDGYPDWSDKKTAGKINPLKQNEGWHWINGASKVKGQLFGGCIEALEFIKSTDYWPTKKLWDKKILFLETSEEKPSVDQVKYMLRNYGIQGIFDQISALLFGRPIYYNNEEKGELEEAILKIVVHEFGAKKLPIITNIDFGHTDPQLIMPIGMSMEINIPKKTMKICG